VSGMFCHCHALWPIYSRNQTYIFETLEVVSDPNWTPKRWYKLRLRVKDDAKGPVTAVCGINGYLASSMGQKADRLFCMQRCIDNPCRFCFVLFRPGWTLSLTSAESLEQFLNTILSLSKWLISWPCFT
jgi:hypothetical protein